MNKSAITITTLFIVHSLATVAMQQEPCHLARLPRDVQDLIAGYLTFKDRETDKEFITRAHKKLPTIDNAIKRTIPDITFEVGMGMDPLQFGFSPDRSKIIFVRRYEKGMGTHVQYNVYDRCNKKLLLGEYLNKPHTNIEPKGHRIAIALSQDTSLLAEITSYRSVNLANPLGERNFLLTVKSIAAGTLVYDCLFPEDQCLCINFCDFNKQGTKIILRGINAQNKPTFATCILVSEQEHKKKSFHVLDDYLGQQGVCKTLKSSLS